MVFLPRNLNTNRMVERNPTQTDLRWFGSSITAQKAMRKAVIAIDAHAVTLMAADRVEKQHGEELRELRAKVAKSAAAYGSSAA